MIEDSILPEWLKAELPEMVEPHRIALDPAGGFLLIDPDGEAESFLDLKSLSGACRQFDLVIDQEIHDTLGDEGSVAGMLTYPAERGLFGTIIPMSDKTRLHLLEGSFEYSLKCSIRFNNQPDDFFSAYHFIDAHPAFWINAHRDGPSWHWLTSGHCERVHHYVAKEGGKLFIGLETGGHVEGETHPSAGNYTTHYADYRLDSYGDTFEEAFIELAKKVNEFFNPDGSAREGVESEKPEWLQEAERRIEEIENWTEDENESE